MLRSFQRLASEPDDRLLKLLIAAWSHDDAATSGGVGVQTSSWKPAVLDKLLADADCAGTRRQ